MASEEHTNDQGNEAQGAEAHDQETRQERSEAYEQARSQFDDLGSEEKAAFLVESIIHTVADGLKEVSDQVSDAFKQACEKAEEEARKYRESSEHDEEDVVVEEQEEGDTESKESDNA